MKYSPTAQAGFTLVEILIIVAIIGLIAAVAIPKYARSRMTAQRNACIANLRQIDGAKQGWSLENKKPQSAVPADSEITHYLKDSRMPLCPAGGTYKVNAVSATPTCSKGSSDGHTL